MSHKFWLIFVWFIAYLLSSKHSHSYFQSQLDQFQKPKHRQYPLLCYQEWFEQQIQKSVLKIHMIDVKALII